MDPALSTSCVPSSRQTAWLFVAFACFYALCSGGHIDTPDGTVMFRVTSAMVDRRALDIRPLQSWPDFGGAAVVDPTSSEKRFYAKFGVGQSLAAIPAYLAGRALLPLARDSEKDLFETGFERARRKGPTTAPHKMRLSSPANYRELWYSTGRKNFAEAFLAFCASLTNALIVAGIVAGVSAVCVELGYSPRTALATAILAGLASPLWHYSKTFFSEPLAGLGLTWFLYYAIRGSRPDDAWRSWTMAGVMLGVAILAKVFHVVLIPAAAMLLAGYGTRLPAREAARRAAGFAGGLLWCFGLIVAYNLARFGNPVATGYGGEWRAFTTPAIEGLAGLLISPGRGLLVYCPLVVVAAIGARRFGGRRRLELLFILLCLVSLTAAYAKWHMWHGGWCWGPRFLLPVIPLLLLPVAAVIDSPPKIAWIEMAIGLLVGLAFLVSLSGVVVSYNDYHSWLKSALAAPRGNVDWGRFYRLVCWTPPFTPATAYWAFRPKDYFLASHAIRQPGLVLGMFAAFAAGTIVGATGLVRAWVRVRK